MKLWYIYWWDEGSNTWLRMYRPFVTAETAARVAFEYEYFSLWGEKCVPHKVIGV